MKPFPIDIWIDIAENYLQREDYIALSYTCSFLRTLSQHLLFRDVHVSGYCNQEDDAVENKEIISLARTLAERPELRLSLRTLNLEERSRNTLYNPSFYLQHPLLSQLSTMCNLRSLRVTNFRIDLEFYRTIAALPSINTLEFEYGCSVDPDIRMASACMPCRGLTHFALHLPRDGDDASLGTWSGFVGPKIRALRLGVEDTQTMASFLSRLTMSSRFTALTTLVLQVEGPSDTGIPVQIIAFLEFLLSLRRLSLRTRHNRIPWLDRLPEGTVPFLEEYSGPVVYATVFLPGRPVHSVEYRVEANTQLSETDLEAPLHLSTVFVTRISFSFSPGVFLSRRVAMVKWAQAMTGG